MKTAVIGFPRIGKNRELKFAEEKYFKGEFSNNELLQEAKAQRSYSLKVQKNADIDFISSNDFSFYDGVLDTAVLFNAIPERYKNLNLSALDTYFAMARGYQGEHGNVKALAMKKWFNTNYHYIVPEIEDNINPRRIFERNNNLVTEGNIIFGENRKAERSRPKQFSKSYFAKRQSVFKFYKIFVKSY